MLSITQGPRALRKGGAASCRPPPPASGPVSALVSFAAALPGGGVCQLLLRLIAGWTSCCSPQLGEGTLALNFVIRTTEIPVPQSYPESRL